VKIKIEPWKCFVATSAEAFVQNSATADTAQLLSRLETEMWSEHYQGGWKFLSSKSLKADAPCSLKFIDEK
jgi:hypothetical protein